MEEIRGLRSDLAADGKGRSDVLSQIALTNQALGTLALRVDEFAVRDQKDHDELRDCVEEVRVLLVGDKNTNGVLVRVDRLEQRQDARSRTFWWAMGIGGTVIGGELGVLVHLLLKGGP